MKKVIIGIFAVFAVLGILVLLMGYRYYEYNFFTQRIEGFPPFQGFDYFGRFLGESKDDNFPYELIPFWANKEKQDKISDLLRPIPEKDKLFQKDSVEKLLQTVSSLVSNDLYRFNEIIPIIKNKMKETKNSTPVSFKDSEKYPDSPSFKTINNTAKYWFIVSRKLEQRKEFETPLYLSHATFYLLKDYQSNYRNSGSLMNKMGSMAVSDIACNSILIWASIPKPQCREQSKVVAKDILDFVNNEYPFSRVIEFELFASEDVIDYYANKGDYMISGLRKSGSYEEIKEICFKNPMKFFDKPLYEIKKELTEYSEQRNKLLREFTSTDYAFYLLFNPTKMLGIYLARDWTPNFKKAKEDYEASLAKMEMTAIALAINSFVCEKNKYPESMDELSEWFGTKLPNNRITNEPYELDFEGEHVIYNKSVPDKEIFFDFSMR
jgi:hypothetical protein